MIARGVEVERLERIAAGLGFRLEHLRPVGRGWGFVLRVARPLAQDKADTGDPAFRLKGRRKVPSYRAQSRYHGDRWTNGSVCWHGHAEFMRRLFDAFPAARLDSKVARYEGRVGFLASYEGTGSRNVGSMMSPVALGDSCRCGRPDPRSPESDEQPRDFLPYVMGYGEARRGARRPSAPRRGPERASPEYFQGFARGALVHRGKASPPPWIHEAGEGEGEAAGVAP